MELKKEIERLSFILKPYSDRTRLVELEAVNAVIDEYFSIPIKPPIKTEIADKNKTVEQVELELLENIIERFSGVYPEYHRSIIDDMIEDIKNPGI